MGLDMYLTAKLYVSPYDYDGPLGRDKPRSDGILEAIGCPDIGMRVTGVDVRAAYWRKANQIHSWFVQNVQNGKDDCREYIVSREQLQELLKLALTVQKQAKLVPAVIENGSESTNGGPFIPVFAMGEEISNKGVAEELLPTRGGFFFGSTAYDEYYMQDIENTVAQLEKALAMPGEWDFYYSSSW